MSSITMSPETLAHHLRVAADKYDSNAAKLGIESAAEVQLILQFERQAAECRAFADALGNIRSIGFDAADRIEIEILPS